MESKLFGPSLCNILISTVPCSRDRAVCRDSATGWIPEELLFDSR